MGCVECFGRVAGRQLDLLQSQDFLQESTYGSNAVSFRLRTEIKIMSRDCQVSPRNLEVRIARIPGISFRISRILPYHTELRIVRGRYSNFDWFVATWQCRRLVDRACEGLLGKRESDPDQQRARVHGVADHLALRFRLSTPSVRLLLLLHRTMRFEPAEYVRHLGDQVTRASCDPVGRARYPDQRRVDPS
jgi:hypothetical protein